MLQSRIERVDMNPYWNIPYSIVKKEIAPRHAGDEAYFSRNRYRIFNKETGEELPPAAVTSGMLTSGRYRIRQDNGEGNSLGRLIFRFPNNFSIYLHDTNNRQAFKRTNRAQPRMYPNRKTTRTGRLFIGFTRRKNSKQAPGSDRTTSVEFIRPHRKERRRTVESRHTTVRPFHTSRHRLLHPLSEAGRRMGRKSRPLRLR